jgi:hypothetical protein
MKEDKNNTRMDSLLDQAEPYATFHDAELCEMTIDYKTGTLAAEFELCVGNPDGKTDSERERHRKGILRVSGLVYWAIELPGDKGEGQSRPLWLTGDGLIAEASTKTVKELASTLPPETYGWYMYFSNLNAFAYLAAKEAVFEW